MTDTELQAPTPPTPDEPFVAEGDLTGKLGLTALLIGLVALGWFGGWSILLVVLAIVVMIFMHELGHYLTAKAAGMKVTEFFIGFGPRIWSFRRGETEYGIKAIWLGAYVRIIGMNNLEEVDPAEESRTYRQKSYPRRMSVAVAGSAMHFLMALALAFVALVGFGEYTSESARNWTAGELSTAEDIEAQFAGLEFGEELERQLGAGETPAVAAGIEEGDRILAADGVEFEEFTDLRDFVQEHPGEEVAFTVERGDETFDTNTTIGAITDGETSLGYLGLGQDQERERLGVLEGAQRSVSGVAELMWESVKAIGRFFSPSGLSAFYDVVVNPDADAPPALDGSGTGTGSGDDERIISIVGAARLGAQATDADGAIALLQIMVILNVFIGLFNLIPLLPFDGGHVAVGTYERIREIGTGQRYQADLTKMMPVAYAVVIFMVTIGAMALYADIADPINFPG